jgi:hypothetical protein
MLFDLALIPAQINGAFERCKAAFLFMPAFVFRESVVAEP